MSGSHIYVPSLVVAHPRMDTPTASAEYLRGLTDGMRLAQQRTISEALWWYDTGHHAGFTEGRIVGYRAGRTAGVAEGFAGLTAELDASRREWLDAHNRELVDVLTSTPPFAELCDLRGDPQRAARQRQILAERRIDA